MAKTKQTYLLPVLALITANILWGINTPLLKLGLETIPVPIFMAIRFLAASLILLPFALKTWKPLKRRDFLLLILCSILYITVSALALNIGLTMTSSINAAVINSMGPLILMVLSVEFLKERLNLKTFTGIIVALAGSIVIIGKPWEASGTNDLLGNIFIVAAVLSSVIGTLLFKPLVKKTSSYQATFMSLFFGIIPIAIYGISQLQKWDIRATSSQSIQGLVFSTIAIVAANFLFFYALQRKKAQDTGVYNYIHPVATIVAAWTLLAERPSTIFIAGASLVFLGLYLAEMHKKQRSHHFSKRQRLMKT